MKQLTFFLNSSPHGDMVSVHWTEAAFRYHFWLVQDDQRRWTCQNNRIYKNPPLGTPARDHKTQRLDATAKRWTKLVAAILSEINANDMVQKAREQALLDEKLADQAWEAARIEAYRTAFLRKAEELIGLGLRSSAGLKLLQDLHSLHADETVRIIVDAVYKAERVERHSFDQWKHLEKQIDF